MDKNNVLVSVVTTCYNQQDRISDAIKSISIQDYPFWELVIVDDCSTDKSQKIIRKCIKSLKIVDKVKVITHSENAGCGRSLRDAIENSSGELIAVVDGDDALADNKALKKMVKSHLKHPEAALVYSNYTECNIKLRPLKVYRTRQLEEGRTYLGTKIRISHLKCFKRSFYNMTEGVNPRLRQTVDKDLVLKLEEVGKLLHLNENLYYYREHRNNLTKSFRRRPKSYKALVTESRLEVYAEARSRRGLPPKSLTKKKKKEKIKVGVEKSSSYYNSHLKQTLKKEYRWYDLYEEASKLLPPPDIRTIVDLGCGVGGFAKLLFKKGYKNFLGIDFSTYGIQLCKKRVPNFTFMVGDIFSETILKKIGDHSIFTILEVLEHVNRDIDLLYSIPSGSIVVFSVPNINHGSHVRFFNNTDEVRKRYKKVVKFDHIITVDKREKPGQKMFLFKTVRL